MAIEPAGGVEGAKLRIRILKSYAWTPQPDITAYELAQCIPVLISTYDYRVEDALEALPLNVRRHFQEIPNAYGG